MIIDEIRTKMMLKQVLNEFSKDYSHAIYSLNPFPPSELQIKDYIELWIEKFLLEKNSLLLNELCKNQEQDKK